MATDLRIDVVADIKDAINGLKNVNKEVASLSKQTAAATQGLFKLEMAKTVFSVVWAAIKRAVQAIREFINYTVEAANRQIAAEQQLAAAIRNTSFASQETFQAMKRTAAELSDLTGVADEEIIPIIQRFVTSGLEINKIRDATLLTLDMMQQLGRGTEDTAKLMTKLLLQPNRAIDALSDAGIVLTAEQKKMIDTLRASGDMAKYQAYMFDLLKKKYGGASEAMASPVDHVKNAWGDAMETIGEWFTVFGRAVADMVLPVIRDIRDLLPQIGSIVAEYLGPIVKGFINVVHVGVKALQNSFYSLVEAIGWAVEGLGKLTGSESLQSFGEGIKQFAKDTKDVIANTPMWGDALADAIEKARKGLEDSRNAANDAKDGIDQIINPNQAEIDKVLEDLRAKLDDIRYTEEERLRMKLQSLNASKEEVAEAIKLLRQTRAINEARQRAADMENKAKSIVEALKTDEDKIREAIREANMLRKEGYLTDSQYLQFLKRQREQLASQLPEPTKPEFKRAAAVVGGEVGTQSAVLRAIDAYRNAGKKPEEDTAKNTAKMVQQLDALIGYFERGGREDVEL